MKAKEKATEISRICAKITAYRDETNKEITGMHKKAQKMSRELKANVDKMIDFECAEKNINPIFIKNIL